MEEIFVFFENEQILKKRNGNDQGNQEINLNREEEFN